jgi:hypothetical protein
MVQVPAACEMNGFMLVCCVAQMAQARLDCDYCDVGRTSLLAMHLLFKLPISDSTARVLIIFSAAAAAAAAVWMQRDAVASSFDVRWGKLNTKSSG